MKKWIHLHILSFWPNWEYRKELTLKAGRWEREGHEENGLVQPDCLERQWIRCYLTIIFFPLKWSGDKGLFLKKAELANSVLMYHASYLSTSLCFLASLAILPSLPGNLHDALFIRINYPANFWTYFLFLCYFYQLLVKRWLQQTDQAKKWLFITDP